MKNTKDEAGDSALPVGAFSFMQRTSPTGRKAELRQPVC